MGISFNMAKNLIILSKEKQFGDVIEIGRLNLYDVEEGHLKYLLNRYKLKISADLKYICEQTYTEEFLIMLGANKVDSIDNSSYEGASIIHNMNKPIPEYLRQKYDMIIDGGSLEHMFNFPIAIKNAMDLCKVKGVLVIEQMGNNYMGHGFYNFSSELFYRVLGEENGFRISKMEVYEDYPCSIHYHVPDAAAIKSRIELRSNVPCGVLIYVEAIKLKQIDSFKIPQESDYQSAWSEYMGKEKLDHSPKTITMTSCKTKLAWLITIRKNIKFFLLINFTPLFRIIVKKRKLTQGKKFSINNQPHKFIPIKD